MSWSTEHDVLFGRELLVNNPFQHKAGSRERGQCWDLIAGILNSLDQPKFKVDQRSLRDHLNKLLKEYARRKADEEKASGIEVDVEEIDVLMEDITVLKNESELAAKAESDVRANKAQEEFKAADSVRRQSMETWAETRKRENENDIDDISPKRKRNNGNDTINFLREKSQNEMELRKEELDLKRQELEFQKEREKQNNARNDQLVEQCNKQNQAMIMLLAKLAEKF